MDSTEFTNILAADSPTLYDLDSLEKAESSRINQNSRNPNLNQLKVSPVHQNLEGEQNLLDPEASFGELSSINWADIPFDLPVYNILPEISTGNRSDLADAYLTNAIQPELLTQEASPQHSAQNNLLLPVKQETADMDEYRPPSYPGAGYESFSPNYSLPAPSVFNSGTSSKASSVGSPAPYRKSKNLDKNSDDYRKRRERNNIAVRKSREKAKNRTQATEQLVKSLQKDNEDLQKRVSHLKHDVEALLSCFKTVLPESYQRQIAQTLQSIKNRHKQL